MPKISRRELTKIALPGVAAIAGGTRAAAQAPPRMTARQIVERIKAVIGVPWNEKSYRDTFKLGDPDTPVKGVASMFMPTFDVIQRSNAAGLNFVITHEPTVWTDPDLIPPVENDPLYKAKLDYVKTNRMIIWRIHDHWHMVRPDPMRDAETRMLGWEKYVDAADPSTFNIPPMRLRALAAHIPAKRKFKSIRVIGDPELTVRRVGHGGHGLSQCMKALDHADAVLASDVREWEVEYFRDMVRAGLKKAYIDCPHEGEDYGMDTFALWLPKQIPGLRVEFVPTGDRLWTL